MPLLALLALAGCEPPGSASALLYTVDDDEELFVDEDEDGITVECEYDPSRPGIGMKRGLFQKEDGPLFHVRVDFRWTGDELDEGLVFGVDELDRLDIGYHGVAWPTDVGTVTVTDWVALDEVVRMSVSLDGVGDGEGVTLDGTIRCER